jgi:hypothetical protein
VMGLSGGSVATQSIRVPTRTVAWILRTLTQVRSKAHSHNVFENMQWNG